LVMPVTSIVTQPVRALVLFVCRRSGLSLESSSRRLVTPVVGIVLLVVTACGATPGSRDLVPPATTFGTHPGQYGLTPASLVDPFIGTSGGINDFPGADAPFGMIQWSPDTTSRPPGGGYEYTDHRITGFSLTHLSGPGRAAFGDVPILPYVGPLTVTTSPSQISQPFRHRDEAASPGYYRVQLGPPGSPVTTALTVTQRAGLGRFTYPQSAQSHLLFNLGTFNPGSRSPGVGGSATGTVNSSVAISGDEEVKGWVESGRFANSNGLYTLYFDVMFDRPFSSFGTWFSNRLQPASRNCSGSACGAYVTFDTRNKREIVARVGISFVSTAAARANARTEIPSWNFGRVRAEAYSAWQRLLGRVAVEGGSRDDKRVFYTALYHSLLHPNVFSDDDGRYIGFDRKIHHVAPGHAEYANISGWDIYRSQAQLVAWLDPRVGSDIARSVLADFRETGQLPRWSLANTETYEMVGDPADAILADLWAFGARDFNAHQALTAMIKEATVPGSIRPGLDYYERWHYLPKDGSYGCCEIPPRSLDYWGSAAYTLEYATEDAALALMASEIGDTAGYRTFIARAQNWQYLFDPSLGLIRPRLLNRAMEAPFDPAEFDDGFVEGNAYQYSSMVPFALRSLISLEGGPKLFVGRLDALLAVFRRLNGPVAHPSVFLHSLFVDVPDFAWMGNEPSLDIPWEYDFAGAAYRTQMVVRRIAESVYTTAIDGLPGNDDLGEMSSWEVWADLGLYPETPGSSSLALSSPHFTKEVIHLRAGRALTILAPNASSRRYYIQAMSVGGRAWNKAYLPSWAIQKGAKVSIVLGDRANKVWAAGSASSPPSFDRGQAPALAYSLPSGTIPTVTGRGFSMRLGIQSNSKVPVETTWAVKEPSGIKVVPDSGTIWTQPSAAVTVAVRVTAGGPNSQGILRFSMKTGHGGTLPPLAVSVLPEARCLPEAVVPKSDILTGYFNNTGISDDCTPDANLDGHHNSFSGQALEADGIVPGRQFFWQGFLFDFAAGGSRMPDNVVALGQTIPLASSDRVDRLGIIGASTGGSGFEKAVVNYRDGSHESITLRLGNWTGPSDSSPGAATIAATRYRDSSSGIAPAPAFVYAQQFHLRSGASPKSITLPHPTQGEPQLHIFALALRDSHTALSLVDPADSVMSGVSGNVKEQQSPSRP